MSCDHSGEPTSIDKVCQINCNIGSTNSEDGIRKQSLSPDYTLSPKRDGSATGAKPKRKSRGARRRLNAMMSNVSLHFSDTDSEDELSVVKTKVRHRSPSSRAVNGEDEGIAPPPVIQVTLETAESEPGDSHWDGMGMITPNSDRRSSFGEALTDVDEIYLDDPKSDSKGLSIPDQSPQGETDVEDMSNDEEETEESIFILPPQLDILREFGGGTITTKEGDGPFSVEVRNQMSFDEGDEPRQWGKMEPFPKGPDTDSENVDVSDEEPELEGACSQRDLMDFDLLAASQIFMKNVNKTENVLTVPDPYEDGISDSHTDIEDID
ncbi:uncharacterized protein LOC107044601 [Diachasma alloeum]|uniref:uncharacterized protein LOC107044601 n=1 Tax=Diachasma alloeum TaxID=454923 RepID=UPI0007381157|nr:uncharacterized protein LOC107044601 [Diachasma alloeum]